MDDLDLELAEMDDEGPSGMHMDVSTSGPSNLHDMASPPVRSPNKRNRKSTATSVGDFRDMEDDHRLSLGRIKSRDRIVDPDDEDNNDGPGAGDFSFGAEDASVPMDLGNDDEFDAGEDGFGDITQDMIDGDISLEAAAIARENEAGEDEEEEEEDDEPLPRPVKTKTKPAARSRAIVLGHELVPAMSEALSGGGLTHSSCWPGVTRVAMMKCEWASKRPGVSLLLNSQAPGPRKRRKIPACR